MVATVQPNIVDTGEDLAIWHQMLGHSYDKIYGKMPNMKFKSSNITIKDYTICSLARQGRLTFPTRKNKLATPLEMIHVDVWGPYKVCN